MKKLIPILLCLILFFSCENNSTPTGNLTVKLATSKDTVGNASIEDFDENDHVAKIEVTITSTFDNGAISYTGVVENGSVTFTELAIGNYTLVGKAYNKQGALIASGESSTYVKTKDNTATLDINKLEGSGRFAFRIGYQYYVLPEDQLDIRYSITDATGQQISSSEIHEVKDPGVELGLEGELPSGSYIFTAQVYVDGDLVDGCVHAFRICPGYVAGTRFTVRGKPAQTITSGVTVTNSTSNRMKCTVKKSDPVNGKVTLTSVLEELPEGLTQKDITYQWYKNGELMSGETAPTLEVIKDTSIVQYSLIVKTDKLGSWSSNYKYV